MKIRGILFDMDGVLVDSEVAMRESAKKALALWQVFPRDEDFIPFVGRREIKFVGGVAEKYGVPYEPAMKAKAYEFYGEMAAQGAINVYPGVKDLLLWLRAQGVAMAVCSAADRVKVNHNLAAIGVTPDMFGTIVTGEDVTVNKPAPDIYLAGAKGLGLDPADCAVVEDAVSGLKAARAAGALGLAVTTSFTVQQLNEQVGPDAIVGDIPGLRAYLADRI